MDQPLVESGDGADEEDIHVAMREAEVTTSGCDSTASSSSSTAEADSEQAREASLASLRVALHASVRRPRQLTQVSRVQGSRHRVDTCMICLEELLPKHHHSHHSCSHRYHTWCFKKYLDSRLQEGSVSNLSCPECERQIALEEVERVCGTSAAQRMHRLVRNRELANDPNRIPCPRPDCDGSCARPCMPVALTYLSATVLLLACCGLGGAAGGGLARAVGEPWILPALVCSICSFAGFALALVHDDGPPQRSPWPWPVKCSECQQRTCFACREPWHPGRPCSSAEIVDEWARYRDAMRCPRCKRMIERSEGCNHMSCRTESGGCGYEFCWACGGPYDADHFSETGCPQFGSRDGDLLKGTWLSSLSSPLLLLSGVVATEVVEASPMGADDFICISVAFLLAFIVVEAKREGLHMGCFSLLASIALGVVFCLAWLALEGASNSAIALAVEWFAFLSVCLALMKWRLHMEIDGKTLGRALLHHGAGIAILEVGKMFTHLISLMTDSLKCGHRSAAGLRDLCNTISVLLAIVAALFEFVSVAASAFLINATYWDAWENLSDRTGSRWNRFAALLHIGLTLLVLVTQLLMPFLDAGPHASAEWMLAGIAGAFALTLWGYCILLSVAPGVVIPGLNTPAGAACCLWLCRLMLEVLSPLVQTAVLQVVVVLLLRSLAGFIAGASLPVPWRRRSCAGLRVAFRVAAILLGLGIAIASYWLRGQFAFTLRVEQLAALSCALAVLSGQVAVRYNFYVSCHVKCCPGHGRGGRHQLRVQGP
mmetsp:Transcript_46702/g.111069  ORF Transcript_46702/g.111069 Transcript_46702/m.111069 type:complete len:772 (-) Transcript_46702:314-2629(-)